MVLLSHLLKGDLLLECIYDSSHFFNSRYIMIMIHCSATQSSTKHNHNSMLQFLSMSSKLLLDTEH